MFSHMTLEPGDLLLTGTPSGVGRIVEGDHVFAGIEGRSVSMDVKVVQEN